MSINYDNLIRHMLFKEAFEKMSPEERSAYVLSARQKEQHNEVMNALNTQQAQLEGLLNQNHFWRDFGANIAGNAAYDSALWLASRLLKLIK